MSGRNVEFTISNKGVRSIAKSSAVESALMQCADKMAGEANRALYAVAKRPCAGFRAKSLGAGSRSVVAGIVPRDDDYQTRLYNAKYHIVDSLNH